MHRGAKVILGGYLEVEDPTWWNGKRYRAWSGEERTANQGLRLYGRAKEDRDEAPSAAGEEREELVEQPEEEPSAESPRPQAAEPLPMPVPFPNYSDEQLSQPSDPVRHSVWAGILGDLGKVAPWIGVAILSAPKCILVPDTATCS